MSVPQIGSFTQGEPQELKQFIVFDYVARDVVKGEQSVAQNNLTDEFTFHDFESLSTLPVGGTGIDQPVDGRSIIHAELNGGSKIAFGGSAVSSQKMHSSPNTVVPAPIRLQFESVLRFG